MLRRLTIGLIAGVLLAGAHAASAQTVVFDSLTNFGSYTTTSSTPHTQLGQIFNLGNLGSATSPVSITGSDFLIGSQAAATYTDVQVTQYFWGTASGATTGTTAAYSNLLGSVTYDLGAQTFASGFVYTFNGGASAFSNPVVLSGLTTSGQIGFSELVRTNSGAGLVLNDALLPAFTSGVPTVGSNALVIGGVGGYYRNALSESNGNFVGSDARTLTSSVNIGMRLYASAVTVPETSSVAMFLTAALPLCGLIIRRRNKKA